jgi:transposase
MAPGAIASHVARRFGVSTGQFYTWRKAMLLRSAACGGQQALAKADFAEARLSAPNPKPSAPSQIPTPGMMEITLPGGAMIRVDAAVDGAALGRVLAALAGR